MNRQDSNKIRKVLVAMLTIVALAVGQCAWAQTPDLYYIVHDWNGYAVTTSQETYTKGSYTELRGSHPRSTLEMNGFVYAVMDNTEYHRIIVPKNKTVQLILCDGAKLTTYECHPHRSCALQGRLLEHALPAIRTQQFQWHTFGGRDGEETLFHLACRRHADIHFLRKPDQHRSRDALHREMD